MNSRDLRNVVMIGGPNGAGKTTWAVRNLASTVDIDEFVNADEIARGLSPLKPERVALAAGKAMLTRLNALVDAGDSFAFETTCAGRTHVRLLQRCRAAGYRIMLVFLWLPSIQAACARVARRVAGGGHAIPDDIIARRYRLGVRNMQNVYLPLADTAIIFDNSDGSFVTIAEQRFGCPLTVLDYSRWNQIEEAVRWQT
jgi:predicted ABC-type ATPase